MLLRRLQISDLSKIDEIWQRCHKGTYGIPAHKFVVTDAVVENEKITGYGIVRLFGEALLYLDKDISKFQQAKTFKLLMDQAIQDCQKAGLDQLNVGVSDPNFENILRERYGFKDRNKMLYLEY